MHDMNDIDRHGHDDRTSTYPFCLHCACRFIISVRSSLYLLFWMAYSRRPMRRCLMQQKIRTASPSPAAPAAAA